jgi:hypothetical protein
MDKDDGGFGARSIAFKAEHDHVQPHTLNLDKLAGGRMGGLESCNSEGGGSREYAEEHSEREQIK